MIRKADVRVVRFRLGLKGECWKKGSCRGARCCLMDAFGSSVGLTAGDPKEFDDFLKGLGCKNGPQHPAYERGTFGLCASAAWNDDAARTWEHVNALLAYAEQEAPE